MIRGLRGCEPVGDRPGGRETWLEGVGMGWFWSTRDCRTQCGRQVDRAPIPPSQHEALADPFNETVLGLL